MFTESSVGTFRKIKRARFRLSRRESFRNPARDPQFGDGEGGGRNVSELIVVFAFVFDILCNEC